MSLVASLRSEWIKFRTVRSTPITLVVAAILCVGIGSLICFAVRTHWNQEPLDRHLAFDPTRTSLFGFFFAEIAIGVIGALVITAEYSSGLIRATLGATPRRLEVLTAKAAVLFCATLVVGEACSFASFLVGQAVLHSAYGPPTATLSSPGTLRALTLAGLSLALLALVALGIGTMLRHTAGSITVFVVLLLVVLLIVQALPTSWSSAIDPYLPEVLAESMRAANSGAVGVPSFSPVVASLVLSAYAVGSLIVGGALLVRRDA